MISDHCKRLLGDLQFLELLGQGIRLGLEVLDHLGGTRHLPQAHDLGHDQATLIGTSMEELVHIRNGVLAALGFVGELKEATDKRPL